LAAGAESVPGARALQRAWTRRGPLALALWPLSLLFQAVTALRRTLYRRRILQAVTVRCPVIVVGNLMVGGTGKTPLVIALVEALRARGYTPGVISRGYGGSADRQGVPVSAADGAADAARLGDEVALIVQRTGAPVTVGRDRAAAAESLLNQYPQVDLIISDDGLQHYRLARTFDIAVFDARGAGNGWLLPAGPLREPPGRLRDVDAVVLNGQLAHTGVMNQTSLHGALADSPATPFPPSFHMQVRGTRAFRLNQANDFRPLSAFRQITLLAVAGIGQPGRFFDLLRKAGLHFETLILPDHFDYRDHSFTNHAAEVILMTEKDAVKCRHMSDPRLWVVPVDAEVDVGLVELILEKLRGSAPA